MENFTNEVLDTTCLPKYEEINLTPLHKKYWIIVLIHSVIFYCIVIGIAFAVFYNSPEISKYNFSILAGLFFFIGLNAGFKYLKYKSKKYAFRNHDAIFRNGVISLETMIIPYNRIQHVGLQEGILSRFFGLATVQIFTAGGNSSDLEIPGILKEQAENIKQLLMNKIQKEL